MIGIIDYGAGNLQSVRKACVHLGAECVIVDSARALRKVKKVILPGVGQFGSAIPNLVTIGLYEALKSWLDTGRPFLGICLGMQILYERSEESMSACGFGILRGKVTRFNAPKVPQIGWNEVHIHRRSLIMQGIASGSFFYFLHSYYVPCFHENGSVATSEYGVRYTSVIAQENIYAVQFHPEKSGIVGLQVLKNWINLC